MKISRALVVALVLPIGLAAQQAPAASAANPITTVFKGQTLRFQRNLAQAFDSIPESKYGYKPTPAQLSIGYIAQHLADDNYFFCDLFGTMKATRPEKDTATPDSVKAKWPKDTLVAKLSDEITMTYGGNSRKAPRAGMVLGHVIDMADHYSQIANYMRLNGMLPPTALNRRM
jgi:uncharacterized protein YdeI (BOF family)